MVEVWSIGIDVVVLACISDPISDLPSDFAIDWAVDLIPEKRSEPDSEGAGVVPRVVVIPCAASDVLEAACEVEDELAVVDVAGLALVADDGSAEAEICQLIG
jgi:hypothetical protein